MHSKEVKKFVQVKLPPSQLTMRKICIQASRVLLFRILFTCRKLVFFKAFFTTDHSNVGQQAEENIWDSLNNKLWCALDSRELYAHMEVSRRALFLTHFMQLGRGTMGLWVSWSHGQNQTWKIMQLVVSFSEGKLESSRKHKGTQGKYVVVWKAEAPNAWNRGTQMKRGRGWHRQVPRWTQHQKSLTVPPAADFHTRKFPTHGHNLRGLF